MIRTMLLASILTAASAWAKPAESGELLPPDRPIEEAVDHYVDARVVEAGVKPAGEADDSTFVRRLTLDLIGRVPTIAEVQAFVDSTDPEKRVRLVDRLMASPGYARHQADSFDDILMAGVKGSLRDYLLAAFREDRSWDRIFREIMTGDESTPDLKGCAEFLRSRARDGDRLTSDVSSAFFGVNVSCAKCHDHPLVDDWKQDHYYGMKSFLDRTFLIGEFVAEKGFGSVKFTPIDAPEKSARFLFLTGQEVEIPAEAIDPPDEVKKAEKKRLDEAKEKKERPAPPAFSARAKLVEVALEPGGRDFFARSIANRVWHRFFGQGLVMPLDQMHSENPPTHPELLEWLARDVIDHGYDLRRLTRGLVLSRAYARDGRAESDYVDPRLFAVAAPRALTPTQLAASMWVATTDPASLPGESKLAEVDAKVEPLADRGRTLARSIARPGEDYQIGAAEALLMSNGDKLDGLLADDGDRLVSHLARIDDPRERVELAVRNILSRAPEDEELDILAAFLEHREDRPAEGCRQMVWALLNGAEFRFNH
ncbi:DUF1549 domain-containing protein [Tundrisphaera lichenicola]|uniref:DUF1549 domain-containing protein n=1 Tax=Tundrisphaera lichenicola TaxID=2029860 RepID=UPI003EBDACF2